MMIDSGFYLFQCASLPARGQNCRWLSSILKSLLVSKLETAQIFRPPDPFFFLLLAATYRYMYL